MPLQKKYLTKEQALQKLKQYCAYQERSHAEVQQKLWDLGVRRAEHDEILSTLIEENYLNEERFAVQFAELQELGQLEALLTLKTSQNRHLAAERLGLG